MRKSLLGPWSCLVVLALALSAAADPETVALGLSVKPEEAGTGVEATARSVSEVPSALAPSGIAATDKTPEESRSDRAPASSGRSELAPARPVAPVMEVLEQASKVQAEIDLGEPPFYMMSHFELTEVTPSQRKYYLEKLPEFLKRLKSSRTFVASEGITPDRVRRASENEDAWENLMLQVYRACQDSLNKNACDHLLTVREKAIDMRGRMSASDRDALQKEVSK